MVSIIILSYNTKDLLENCLKSVYERIRGVSFEIIVVDNASQDSSAEMVKSKFPKVNLLRNTENVGFGKAVNLGVLSAKGEHLLFLNSDAEVNVIDLDKMCQLFNDHKIGIIGGEILNTDGSAQRSFGNFYSLKDVSIMLFGREKTELLLQNAKTKKKVDWVSGGFMLARRDIFQQLNGFDENLFMYIEDMELCFRAQKKGYEIWFFPQASITHIGQGSSSRAFAIVNIYKGLIYFYRKHKSYPEYLAVKSMLLLKAYAVIIIGIIKRDSVLVKTYQKAIKF